MAFTPTTQGSTLTHPSGILHFERLFRAAAGVKLDKNDVRRFREFIDERIDAIAVAGRNIATSNGRDVITPHDLPITKGLQERMREFDKFEQAEDIYQLLRLEVRKPPQDVTFADDTEELLPQLFGGLAIALAQSFTLIDPALKNPRTEHWERAFKLFRLVM